MASRAQTRLGEFLIFKRALWLRRELEGGDDVITGTKAQTFQQAIREWMALDLDPTVNDGFFNPFGTRSASSAYRPLKFGSNGPSDTMKRLQAVQDAPFKWIPDSSPMTFRFTPQPANVMRNRFIGSDQSLPLPRLTDVAAWWFRGRDISILQSDNQTWMDRLIDDLKVDNDLTDAEVDGLFDSSPGLDDELVDAFPDQDPEA